MDETRTSAVSRVYRPQARVKQGYAAVIAKCMKETVGNCGQFSCDDVTKCLIGEADQYSEIFKMMNNLDY